MTKEIDSKTITKIALFAVALGFLGLFGSDLYLPAMPAMKIAFNSSISQIEFSVAIYIIGFGLSSLAFGPLADRYGRKKIVGAGLSIALIGAIMAGLSHSINTFLFARLIQGFGAGSTLVIFRIMLRDVVEGKQMAILASYTTMAFNLSPILGMVIGGYIVHYANWRVCFLVLILSYLLFLPTYFLFCPETLKENCPIKLKKIISNYFHLLNHRRLIGSALCSGLASSTVFAFATSGAFIFQQELHVSALTFGWLGLALSLASIIGKIMNAKLVSKFALSSMMTLGMIFIAIAGASLLATSSHRVLETLLLICLATGSTAFILSNAMAIGMQSHGKGTGYAASLYGCIQLLTSFVTNGLLAHFAHFGILSLGVFYLAIALIGITLKTITIREKKHAQTKDTAFTR